MVTACSCDHLRPTPALLQPHVVARPALACNSDGYTTYREGLTCVRLVEAGDQTQRLFFKYCIEVTSIYEILY